MYNSDYHMHTNYSSDGKSAPEEMIESAIGMGLEEIAITDHCDFLFKEQPFPYQIDYKEYKSNFLRLREKYSGKINIVFGIEIGVNAYSHDTVKTMVETHGFDFVIASSHDISGVDLYYPEFYAGKTKKQAYTEYFENVLLCVKNIDDYSVFGHIDYIARYGRYEDPSVEYEQFKDISDEILKETIRKGKGLEVNTSGFRYGLETFHPSLKLLKRYKQLGGEILTLGSDAHVPKQITSHFKEAEELIKSAGFTSICRFRNMKPEFVKI